MDTSIEFVANVIIPCNECPIDERQENNTPENIIVEHSNRKRSFSDELLAINLFRNLIQQDQKDVQEETNFASESNLPLEVLESFQTIRNYINTLKTRKKLLKDCNKICSDLSKFSHKTNMEITKALPTLNTDKN